MILDEKTPWEVVHKLAKELLQLENNIKKGRKVYLTPDEKPPEGVRVQRGPKGGIYYEVEWGVNIPIKPTKKVPKKAISEEKLQNLTSDQKENLIPKANQDVLHALMDDNDVIITRDVAKRINEEGALYMLRNNTDRDTQLYAARRLGPSHFQELATHKDPKIREELAYRTDANGLRKLMNNDFSGVREVVAEKINIIDLPKMANDKDKDVRKIVKTRLAKLKNLSSMVENFKQTGKIKLNPFFKKLITQIQSGKKDAMEAGEYVDAFFDQIGYGNIHRTIHKEWETDASSRGAALLKDSIMRQFGGKIQYHDGVITAKKWNEYMSKLYNGFNKEKVDKYIRIHKELTKAFLDELYPNMATVSLFRGTTTSEAVKRGDKVKITSNPISSWSSSREVAIRYGSIEKNSITISMKVNKDDIWASFLSIMPIAEGESLNDEFLVISPTEQTGVIIDENY